MFPKCEDAKRYGCGRSKTTAIIGAADAENTMVDYETPCFRNCSGRKQRQRVANAPSHGDVHRGTSKCGKPTALSAGAPWRKIGNLILDTLILRGILVENCIAFSADNANVMVSKKNGVAAVLEAKIVIGCPCHLINLAAGKGAACLPAKFDEVLVDINYLGKSTK
ncbi:hypothetical protein HPB50_015844 [Hyalomma asiaticum]|uniref:Uncharacterized protein n=1 Tax=Hyalomma asiaticum TaxID=266040 RepID=A0ACB7SF66_HYAAI|nr:hypothetical protein HPB50_015844 [Hyalomma asiaticum]